jgi:hypothetical protein
MTYQSPPERPGTRGSRAYDTKITFAILSAFAVLIILAAALAWYDRTNLQQRSDAHKNAASSQAKPDAPSAK